MPKNKRSNRSASADEEPSDGLMTIADFCKWAKISKTQYYTIRRSGEGPVEIRFRFQAGGRASPRITREEAANWARRMTAKQAEAEE